MFTTGQLPPNFPRFQTRKALFILELQNDFLSVDGELPVNTCPGFVDNIKTLVPVFRGLGDVVWVRSEFNDPSVTADPPEIEEVFSSKKKTSASEEGGADDHTVGDKDQDEDEHYTQAAEDNANAHDHQRSHGGVSSRSQSRSASSGPSDRVQWLPHRTSTGVKSKQDGRLAAAKPDGASSVQSSQPLRHPRSTAICCVPGSWGADFIAEIKPFIDEENDRLVVKSCFSAFDDTSLLLLLRSSFVTELYICGSRSHASVYATAADAVRHGFSITIVEDCLGYRVGARHMEAMRQMADVMGADGITSTELVEEITGTSPTQEDSENDKESSRSTAHSPRLETASNKASESINLVAASDIAIDDEFISAENIPTREGGAGMNDDSHHKSELSTAVITTRPTSFALAETQRQVDTDAFDEASTTRIEIAPADASAQAAGQDAIADFDIPELSTTSSNELGYKPNPSKIRRERVPVMRQHQKVSKSVVEGTGKSLLSKVTTTSHLTPAPFQPNLPISSASNEVGSTESISSSVQLDQAVGANDDYYTLGPSDKIGEGDSQIVYDILSKELADDMFRQVRDKVRWQKMYHRTGEVPRLVAVQGEVGSDGSIPVYRHPADETPPLQCFSPTVSRIRDVAAKMLQQPLNHVLIQLYRDGQDNISEHSDKTLDVVHGSRIVNVSLGARRIMTLRTKRPARQDSPSKPSTRQTQHIPLPHNSMFILGQKTNMRWLHGVRPDKRPSIEKSAAELAFLGERISLTFRHIGTFLNHDSGRIWGQGACSKAKSSAGQVVNGDATEIEHMLRAFGEENQQSHFDWESAYGSGFNVLNFVTRSPRLCASDDVVSDFRVKLYLAELGIAWRLEKPKSRKVPEHATDHGFKVKRQPKFIDVDLDETEIEGDLAILFYLNRFYDNADHNHSPTRTQTASARAFSRVGQAEGLLDIWRHIRDFSSEQSSQGSDCLDNNLLTEELESWESRIGDGQYIAGGTFSMADCALWPVLREIIQKWESWGLVKFPKLARYHELVLQRVIEAKIF